MAHQKLKKYQNYNYKLLDQIIGKNRSADSYEKIFDTLEEIVQKMDSGDISLEKSLDFFEKGMNLIKVAKEKLDQAEARVKTLIDKSDSKLDSEDLG